MAGGSDIARSCDLVVMADDTRIGPTVFGGFTLDTPEGGAAS